MRGVVVKAALVLAFLAPALTVAEEELNILDDIWNPTGFLPGSKIQRGDMAGDTEVFNSSSSETFLCDQPILKDFKMLL